MPPPLRPPLQTEPRWSGLSSSHSRASMVIQLTDAKAAETRHNLEYRVSVRPIQRVMTVTTKQGRCTAPQTEKDLASTSPIFGSARPLDGAQPWCYSQRHAAEEHVTVHRSTCTRPVLQSVMHRTSAHCLLQPPHPPPLLSYSELACLPE